MRIDLRRGPRLADVTQVVDERGEERWGTPGEVTVHGIERELDSFRRLLLVEEIGVDRREQRRVERECLRDDLAVGEQARADDLDLRERRRGVKEPEVRSPRVRMNLCAL